MYVPVEGLQSGRTGRRGSRTEQFGRKPEFYVLLDIRSDDIVEPPPQRSDDHAHDSNLSLGMNETIESIRKSTMRDAHAATRSRRSAAVCAALSGLPVGHREA